MPSGAITGAFSMEMGNAPSFSQTGSFHKRRAMQERVVRM
jgi:hypothetical protein